MQEIKNQTLFIIFHIFYRKKPDECKTEFGRNYQKAVIPAEQHN
jgi:hypothetical protein